MAGNKVIVALIICAAVAAGSRLPGASVKDNESILARRYDALSLEDQSPSEALLTILNGSGIPGGVVVLQSGPEEANYSFHTPAGLSLREILNYLTSVAGDCKWQVNAGVVDLLPKERLPEMLGVIIPEFDYDNTDRRTLLEQRLMGLPEIRKRAIELGLEPAQLDTGLSVYIPPGETRPTLQTFHLKDVTLLQALNAIATVRGGGVWRYIERMDRGKRYFLIAF